MRQFMEDVKFWAALIVYIIVAIIPVALSALLRAVILLLFEIDKITFRIMEADIRFLGKVSGGPEEEIEDEIDELWTLAEGIKHIGNYR